MLTITSVEDLDALYGPVGEASVVKETGRIIPEYRALIEAAPFAVLATRGPGGLDCSPRGDAPGFVRVADETTLLLPDRRGNNRVDSLKNILLSDPQVALLFLIPGIGETLRVNGRAAISADPALCESFTVQGKAPRSVLVITVDRVYFQCQKALVRSKLWDPASRIERSALPSTGTMIAALSQGTVDGEAFDRAYPERLRQTIY
jgi:uncharacterized protein